MLYIFILGGLALSLVFDLRSVQNTQWYLWLTATLLAIGLYSSTFGIAIDEAKRNLKLIVTAVTFGVIFKAFIIGTVLSVFLHNPVGYIYGIIMAQIDPLSTAALLHASRMTQKAKTIIAAWSSFDDPVTVILALYLPVLIALLAGGSWQPIAGTMQDAGLLGYVTETGKNLLFALGVFVLWMFIKRFANAGKYFIITLAAVAMYSLFLGALSTAIYFFWMLGVAVIGLFMRPPVENVLNPAVRWALYMAAILLGMLLINGIELWAGVLLGSAAFLAQIVVGYVLTRRLPHEDRKRIAFAQQNGITAIILALLFEPYYPGTIAVVAPGIITVNILHAVSNLLLNTHLQNNWSHFSWNVQKERVKLHMKKVS